MRNSSAVKEDAQRLLSDLRALGLEAEKLIENSASEMTESALARLRHQFASAQDRFSEFYGTAREKTVAAAKYTDEVVRANPYSSIGVGAVLGLVAGFLIGRSMHSD